MVEILFNKLILCTFVQSPASRRRPSIYGITSSPVKGKTTETPAGKENQTKTSKKIPLEVDSGASSAASSKTTTPDSAVGNPKEKENKGA